jgi:hypothetical protein
MCGMPSRPPLLRKGQNDLMMLPGLLSPLLP